MIKQQSYDNLAQLVEKFATNLNEYKVKNYNEAQARVDFINPFFELLGWDINNRKGMPESYRDVIYEDKLRIGGSVKAPDYCFTINGNRKFFVEAKKPIISLKDKIEPAYQLRRYGWSAKMPISLLTDFEELSLYDCSLKPNPYDGAFVSRLRYLTYNDYLKEFNFLWDVFFREQIEKGSLAQFINANVSKANRSSVDSEFLKSLDKWRDLLARDLVNMNDNLDEDQLNYSLQKIVDRIVFLRICEDRGVEQDEQLFKAIKLSDVYDRLKTIFHTADQKYNSGLFDYNKDNITDNLKVSDMVLRNIIQEMYFPICPYEFSVIPVEILGHSYEQYLGKVIKITSKHDITIEEKPEVRKAGGVYYTPQYIVDYIVKNTVGKLVENKTPEEVSKLKICDPACGSGSFLLGAYQFLLNWHLDYYTANPHKSNPLTPDGNLTTQIKKQILLNNIYGVDIDTNAVEVTKLSLMLKALEGETKASINHQLSWFHDRILPTLDDNIKSGNSLIDIDFYESQIDFEPGQEKKIKPFNWESAFPTVFKQGGFDAVIGNPPYIQLAMFDWFDDKQKIYLLKQYCSSMGRMNTFGFFIEKSIKVLKRNGKLGLIIPNTILTQEYYQKLRSLILENTNIDNIVSYANLVFKDAVVETTTIILSKSSQNGNSIISYFDNNMNYFEKSINQEIFKNTYSNQFSVSYQENDNLVKIKIEQKCKLTFNNIGSINQAIALKYDRASYLFDKKIDDNYKPVIDGREINKYNINWSGKYLLYDIDSIHSCKREDIFLSPEKIFFRRVSSTLIATLDVDQFYALNTLVVINKKNEVDFDIRIILAIFNSKLLNYYYNKFLKSTKKVFSEIQARQIGQLPFPSINLKNYDEKIKHDLIVNLVNVITQLNKDLQSATLPEQKEHIQQRINYTDKQIDKLVYELYELTEEEIKIVEGEG